MNHHNMETSKGTKYEVKEELTGADLIEWRKACLGAMGDWDFESSKSKMNLEGINDIEQAAIKISIVSISDKKDDILGRVAKLPASEYREIADVSMDKVAELNDLMAQQKKEQPDIGNT